MSTNTIALRAHLLRDTYSRLPEPGEWPDLEHFVARLWPPDRPWVEVVCAVPQVRPPRQGAFETLEQAYAETLGEPPKSRGRGQPRRNRYVAAEFAYMLDLERRPPMVRELYAPERRVRRAFTARAQLETALEAMDRTPRVAVSADEGLRSRTLTRWRDDGRRVLHDLGAWPWALETDGRLDRTWWRDPRYLAELQRGGDPSFAVPLARPRRDRGR
jgi:hypothetical protein